VPGFETGIRFVCLSGHPRYLAMYDLARAEVPPVRPEVAFTVLRSVGRTRHEAS